MGILLPLLALLFWAAWQSRGLEGLKEAALGAKEYLPDVSVGLDELSAERVALPAEIQKEVTSLKETLQKMTASTKINCFAKFDGFRSELGNDDGTISLSFAYDPSADLTRVKVNKEKNLISDRFEVKGMKPCVIAGTGDKRNIAENFFNYYFRGGPQFEPYYKQVQAIEIYYHDSFTDFAGNQIFIPEFGEGPVNDEGNNLQSNGFLFKGREGEICFFPTIYGARGSADEDGIAKQWFSREEFSSTEVQVPVEVREGRKNTLPVLLAQNQPRTQWCFEENEEKQDKT